MPRNIYISHGTSSEQNLISDLIAESISVYGHDVYYLPRKIVKLDRILNESDQLIFGFAFNSPHRYLWATHGVLVLTSCDDCYIANTFLSKKQSHELQCKWFKTTKKEDLKKLQDEIKKLESEL